VQKKKPVKRTKKRWNKPEVENQAIIFLVENPQKGFTDFCKKIKISERYFYELCDIQKIYKNTQEIKDKKNQEIIEQVKKAYAKEGRKEGSLLAKLPGIAEAVLAELLNDLKTKKKTLFYKSKSELFGKINDTIKTIVELKERGLMPGEVVLSEEKKEAKQRLDSRIDEIIEFKKEKTNDVNNKNTVDNGNTETPTN